ncbi:hypothetical protein [Solimicrobium silvestre]|uniref:Antimicrobial peptide resistance and lipid A acylation protein PagP n=1 Tax=Solimicrobium silvestre TaxID=2099400 RepID=A0A2S9GV51_9BURK|nr:hypothetical protein [Solimicrobium silvestre]PRC91536.1 hypothetical protein S2091_3814 [Solimicrobium silvestre]
MINNVVKKMLGFILLGLCLNPVAQADTILGMDVIESQPLNEAWLDSGFLSYHFDRDKGLNGDNYGLGAEYRFSTVNAVTVGRFYNSDREYSNYAGLYYQPLAIGPFRLGVVAGGFNGYPKMKDGGWFLAAIPMASAEWGRVGLNIAIVPSYKDRLYGAISLQLKIKVWD